MGSVGCAKLWHGRVWTQGSDWALLKHKDALRALVVTFCLDDVLKRWALNSGVASPEGNLATNAGGDRSIQRHAWTT